MSRFLFLTLGAVVCLLVVGPASAQSQKTASPECITAWKLLDVAGQDMKTAITELRHARQATNQALAEQRRARKTLPEHPQPDDFRHLASQIEAVHKRMENAEQAEHQAQETLEGVLERHAKQSETVSARCGRTP